MDPKNLITALVAGGLARDKAEEILKAQGIDVNADASADEIKQNLKGLRDLLKGEASDPDGVPDEDPEEEDELDEDEMSKALIEALGRATGAEALVKALQADLGAARDKSEALAKAGDAIIAHVTDRQETLVKAHVATLKSVGRLSRRLDTFEKALDERFEALSKGLSIPMPRKSVEDIAVIPAPGEQPAGGAGLTRRDLIIKAVGLLGAEQNPARAYELGQAINLLEAGANPQEIARAHNLA